MPHRPASMKRVQLRIARPRHPMPIGRCDETLAAQPLDSTVAAACEARLALEIRERRVDCPLVRLQQRRRHPLIADREQDAHRLRRGEREVERRHRRARADRAQHRPRDRVPPCISAMNARRSTSRPGVSPSAWTPLPRHAKLRARKPLRRSSSLQRTPSMVASDAKRAAVAGRSCIICGTDRRIDPAHLIPGSMGGCGDPLCVVSACRAHHRVYDRGELDLLPYLEPGWRCAARARGGTRGADRGAAADQRPPRAVRRETAGHDRCGLGGPDRR